MPSFSKNGCNYQVTSNPVFTDSAAKELEFTAGKRQKAELGFLISIFCENLKLVFFV